MAGGRFREDLFYRLNVVPVLIPPLRDRLDDIPLLVQHFAKRTAEENGRQLRGIAPEVVEMLQKYHWPGNVRELGHEVERAVILSSEDVLTPDAFNRTRFGLAPTPRGASASASPAQGGAGGEGAGAGF